MIDKIHIQNFKCLQDVEVELEPFTVLIGPNDSGKTSFLEAISWQSRFLENNGIFNYQQFLPLVWQKKAELFISWEICGRFPELFDYQIQISPQFGRGVEKLVIGKEQLFEIEKTGHVKFKNSQSHANPNQSILSTLFLSGNQAQTNPGMFSSPANQMNPVVDNGHKVGLAIGSTMEYHFNPREMRNPSPVEENPYLSPSGSNLASVVHAFLTGPDRQAIIDMESKLNDEIKTIKGLSTPFAHGNRNAHVLEYTLSTPAKPPVTIPASQVSDGAILLTAFLALAYGNTPQILLIEEPENGLHPSRLKKVIEILRKISTGEIGNQSRQVIITTHSPLLLNFVKPVEIRIFKRDDNGATHITAMDKIPHIERLQKEFAPGELWYLFGEEELVKGQPA